MNLPPATPAGPAVEQLLDLVGERQARRLLAEVGRRSAQQQLERVIVQRFARHLLGQREPRPCIRDRLLARGIPERTAYRVIGQALSAPLEGSATDPPALAWPAPTLEPPQHEGTPMSNAKLRLANEMLACAKQLEAIDIEAATRALESAQRAHAAAVEARLPQNEIDHRSGLRKRAKGALDDLVREQGILTRRVAELKHQLSAEDRASAARHAAEAAGRSAAEAEAKVQEATRALATIEQLCDKERQAIQSARNSAAAQLLAAVKAGGDLTKQQPATSDRLAMLQEAQGTAQRELHQAQQVLAAARSHHTGCKRAVLAAEADIAALVHMDALEDYTEALASFIVTHMIAHNQQPALPNIFARAQDLAEAKLHQAV